MKTAVILNSYSYHNAGDAAIMLSTAEILRNLRFERIVLATRYDDEMVNYRPWGIEVACAPVPFPIARTGRNWVRASSFILRGVVAVVVLALPRGLRSSKAFMRTLKRLWPSAREFFDADLLVIAGGGYLYSSKRQINLSLMHSCLMIWMARRTGTRVMVMPGSIGPVHRRLDRQVIETAIGCMPFVLRERLSMNESTFQPRNLTIIDCPDVAFLLPRRPSGYTSELQKVSQEKIVRVVAMDWRWSRSVKIERYTIYLQQLAILCDLLTEDGYSVVLGGHSALPEHNQDDMEVCRRIAGLARTKVMVDSNCDPAHLYQSYSLSLLVIGTRLHACIMAIAVNTPSISIGYQEKAAGVSKSIRGAIPVFPADNFVAEDVLQTARNLIHMSVSTSRNIARARIEEVYSAYT